MIINAIQTHWAIIDIAWIIIPIFILVLFTLPFLALLYEGEVLKLSYLRLICTGNQWYWSYDLATKNYQVKYDSTIVHTF